MTTTKIKFRNFYVPEREELKPVDCSSDTIPSFVELPPYAKDDKGVIINNTEHPVLRNNGYINIDDEIQSYRDECDLYMLLDRVAHGADPVILQQKEGAFMDISGAPRSINEVDAYLNSVQSNYSKLSNDEQIVLKKLLGLKVEESTVSNSDPKKEVTVDAQ